MEHIVQQNIKKTEDSYNDIPYMSKSFFNTTPNRLSTVLSLFNFTTPNIETARVLEIGCSFGGNIIPLALSNPKMKIIGVDLSKVQVDEGNRIIKSLGLKNIELQHKDICKFDAKAGKFDYIICHGVFSWVPAVVQEAILNVIQNHLAEDGAALISYNTYPGWKNNEVLRDMMMFRANYLEEKGLELTPEEKLHYAKEAINLLKEHGFVNSKIKTAVETIKQKDDYYLLHEYFEDNNHPLYLVDMAKMLEKYQLMHVVDSEVSNSFPPFNDELSQRIAEDCAGNRILIEQYWDYIYDRQFRSSIITHASNRDKFTLSGEVKFTTLDTLHYITRCGEKNDKGIYTRTNGLKLTESDSWWHLLDILAEKLPHSVSTEELKAALKDREYNMDGFYSDLMALIYGKDIDMYKKSLPIVKQEKLKLSSRYKKYLTYFAETENAAISLAGYQGRENYALDNIRLKYCLLCDGTHTDEDLVNELKKQAEAGEISVNPGEGVTVEQCLKDYVKDVRRFIESNLMNVGK